ncbi:maleylpyruvate isomerase family mycothiol-dependent enzyme [Nonomuraea terrae]|uniref:maleylpyruvate isomerase family mycothiol-dependent enzyme n=1 Tax=Nonomuraea terrae TaxID=2530383 RepID=UPI0037930BCE
MSAEPSRLTLTERSGLSRDPEAVREALYTHRTRLAGRLAELSPADWTAPTRCAEWTVHEVARHLVDVAEFHVACLTGRLVHSRFGGFREFDPTSTPGEWLRDSAGRSPEQTIDALVTLTEAEHDSLGRLIDAGASATVTSPLGGRWHWSVLSLHILWDAWMHERDMSATLRAGRPQSAAIQRLVALYGLLVSASAAARSGEVPQVTVRLAGSPDDMYEISGPPGDVRVTAGATSSPHLSGPFEAVLESVAGRGPRLAEVVGVSNPAVEHLSRLTAIMK